jgi:nucleoid DNA-binding protein
MNTSELIRQLAQQLNITQKQAKQLLQLELSAIAEQLALGNEVVVRGFGKFSLRDSRSRKSPVSTTRTVAFRAAQKFRERVKGWKP